MEAQDIVRYVKTNAKHTPNAVSFMHLSIRTNSAITGLIFQIHVFKFKMYTTGYRLLFFMNYKIEKNIFKKYIKICRDGHAKSHKCKV